MLPSESNASVISDARAELTNQPASASKHPTISSEAFLESIFGLDWRRAWVCSFGLGREEWAGRRYGMAGGLRDDHNNYFAIGLLGPDETRRSSEGVVSHHVVFADDIGTKVNPDKWKMWIAMGFPEPAFKIETSPGNQTWIWVLSSPITADDADKVRCLCAVRAALGRLELSDPLPDHARYTRMPSGVNTKEKYRYKFGFAPAVRLVERNVSAVLDIELAASILIGSDWATRTDAELQLPDGSTTMDGSLKRTADMNNPEPIIQLARELGMNPVQIGRGVVEALCPNIGSHTTRVDTGFAFLGNGLMKCNHASCRDLRTPDFTRMMCEEFNTEQNGRAALGMELLPGGRSADEFLARASFLYHDRQERDDDRAASGRGGTAGGRARCIQGARAVSSKDRIGSAHTGWRRVLPQPG